MKKLVFILFIFILLLVIPIKAESIDFSTLEDIAKCWEIYCDVECHSNCVDYFLKRDKFSLEDIWLCDLRTTIDKKEECLKRFSERGGDISLCKNSFAGCGPSIALCVKTYALKFNKESDCDLILDRCAVPWFQPGDPPDDSARYWYKECKKYFLDLSADEKKCYERIEGEKLSASRRYIDCLTNLAIKKDDVNICYKIIKIYDTQDIDKCLFEVARSKNDAKICDQIKTNTEHANYRDECYNQISHITKDSSLCDKIENKVWKESCYERSRPSIGLIVTAPSIVLRYFFFFVAMTLLTGFGILITRKKHYLKGIAYGITFGWILSLIVGVIKIDPYSIGLTPLRNLLQSLMILPIVTLIYGSFGLLMFLFVLMGAIQMYSPAISYILNYGLIYLLGYSLIGLGLGLVYRSIEKLTNKKFAIIAIIILIVFFLILFMIKPMTFEFSM